MFGGFTRFSHRTCCLRPKMLRSRVVARCAAALSKGAVVLPRAARTPAGSSARATRSVHAPRAQPLARAFRLFLSLACPKGGGAQRVWETAAANGNGAVARQELGVRGGRRGVLRVPPRPIGCRSNAAP